MHTQRQVLFVQGGGKGTHDEWDNKLADSLRQGLGGDYVVQYPRMPGEDSPAFSRWKPALEHALAALPDGAILVGHSIGGTILIKVLSEQLSARRFGAFVFIAAPFVGDGGWPSDEVQFPPDLGSHLPAVVPIHYFHGLSDDEVPPSHVDLYASAVPQARVHRLAGRDHQLNNDLSEVAAAILSLDQRGKHG